jgi:hypothetical protein
MHKTIQLVPFAAFRLGVGAGQQSRVDCVRVAGAKALIWYLRQHPRVLGLKFRKGVKKVNRLNARIQFIEGEFTPPEHKAWASNFDEVRIFFVFVDDLYVFYVSAESSDSEIEISCCEIFFRINFPKIAGTNCYYCSLHRLARAKYRHFRGFSFIAFCSNKRILFYFFHLFLNRNPNSYCGLSCALSGGPSPSPGTR